MHDIDNLRIYISFHSSIHWKKVSPHMVTGGMIPLYIYGLVLSLVRFVKFKQAVAKRLGTREDR